MRVEFVACGAVAWYIVLAYCVEKNIYIYIYMHVNINRDLGSSDCRGVLGSLCHFYFGVF